VSVFGFNTNLNNITSGQKFIEAAEDSEITIPVYTK